MVSTNGLRHLCRRRGRAFATGIVTLWVVFGLNLAAWATAARQPDESAAEASAPSTRDSGLEVSHNVGAIGWLSNDVVAFLALVPNVSRSWMIHPYNKLEVLTTWNLKTGESKHHGSPGYGRLCVRDGEVVQSDAEGTEESDGHGGKRLRYWLITGPLERRVKREISREEMAAVDFDIACRPQAELPPFPARLSEFEKGRRRVVRLRPEHGFLEYAPVPEPFHPVRLIPPEGRASAVTVVPPLKGERLSVQLKFFPFKKAYLMTSSYPVSPLPDGVPQKLWWLHADARVEEITTVTRTKQWPLTNVTTTVFVVTKAGVIFSGAEPTLTDRIGKSGLYRLSPGGEAERLVPGRIAGLTVSPDGCKIAFGNDKRNEAISIKQFSLQVLNICEGAKQ